LDVDGWRAGGRVRGRVPHGNVGLVGGEGQILDVDGDGFLVDAVVDEDRVAGLGVVDRRLDGGEVAGSVGVDDDGVAAVVGPRGGSEHREARACQHERQQAHEPRASSGCLRERTVASQLVERT
jgi:hypothetical protein